jgi:hypothetical protein
MKSRQAQVFIILGLWIGLFAAAGRAQNCSPATVQGNYFALLQGNINGSPYLELDKINADANGSLSGTRAISKNGAFSQINQSAAYSINPDCSGMVTVADQPAFPIQIVEGGGMLFTGSDSKGTNVTGQSYRAATHCTDASLYGTYGIVLASGSYVGVGTVNYDGNGGFTLSDNENGTNYGASGTYSVQSDCSGTSTITYNGGGATYHSAIALVQGGEILQMGTDQGQLWWETQRLVSSSSVLGQFAFGGGWYSAVYFTNNNGYAVSFPVNFVADDGTPLMVPSVGSSTTMNLAAQATAIIEAPNSGNLSQGFVSLALPPGVQAYGVFRYSAPGMADQEAVAPLSNASSNQVTLTFDDTAYTTAIAIVNPSPVAGTVSITAVDNTGATIGSGMLNLPANSKTEAALRNITGLAGVAGTRGVATFSITAGNVAVLGLRFNHSAFTSIPAVGN